MARMKRSAMVAAILLLVSIVLSSCDLRYSTPPAVTNTPIDTNSLFATPLVQPTNMSDVQSFATGTALALQTGTPLVDFNTATIDPNNPAGAATVTPTSIIVLPTNAVTTPTATLAVAATNQTVNSTPVPVGSRPATYTLQEGEFPYCIARRFDVDPEQLLSLNGLSENQTLYAGAVLKIPQTGNFPGARALRNHPTTYTASAGETLYAVACAFGDIDPSTIASTNGLSVGATLSAGQQLNIP